MSHARRGRPKHELPRLRMSATKALLPHRTGLCRRRARRSFAERKQGAVPRCWIQEKPAARDSERQRVLGFVRSGRPTLDPRDARIQGKGAARRCGGGTTSGMSSCIASDRRRFEPCFTSDQTGPTQGKLTGVRQRSLSGSCSSLPPGPSASDKGDSGDAHRH